MRTLKYAILGLLNRGPMTGYDIKKAFDDRALYNFWHAEHSQVYPELAKLVKEGLLEYETVITGEKLEKKLYRLTEKGAKDFHDWLIFDAEVDRTPKDTFRLRTYFYDSMDKEEYLNLIHSQLIQHKERRDYLREIVFSAFKTIPDVGTPELGDYLVLDGAIKREVAYIDWLNNCKEIINMSE